jgi:hypothetical protein
MARNKPTNGMTGFQKLIGTSILIVALALAYYLVVYVPNLQKTKQLLENQRQANIQSCLATANQNYSQNWVATCRGLGKDDNCLLFSTQSNTLQIQLKDNTDSCYKLYPTR